MRKGYHPINEAMRCDVLRAIMILDGEPDDPLTPWAIKTVLEFVKAQLRIGDRRSIIGRRIETEIAVPS
jgi:hypothetical protein